MLYEKLQELIKKSNKSMNQIERELGYPRNTISSYKRQNPSTKRLNELAEYFNVSVDYLLGREALSNSDYSDEENDLIAAFRMESKDMTKEEQAQFNKSLKDMMKIAKNLLDDDSNWKK